MSIDWARRFDHMQQHTGQHLLSAVFEESFGLKTVSFHLGAESATIDIEGNADASVAQKAERRANEIVFENRPVDVTFEDSALAQGLRKPSERAGTLRIISIDGVDRSACGGTHVRATGEIGVILIRKLEKIRNQTRVEFLCGGRAVRRARADYEALSRAAQLFSSPLDNVPAMLAEQLESTRAAEKSRRKLELELAAYKGRELVPKHCARGRWLPARFAARGLGQPGGSARGGAELHGAFEGGVFGGVERSALGFVGGFGRCGDRRGEGSEVGVDGGRRARRRYCAHGPGERAGRGEARWLAERPGGNCRASRIKKGGRDGWIRRGREGGASAC